MFRFSQVRSIWISYFPVLICLISAEYTVHNSKDVWPWLLIKLKMNETVDLHLQSIRILFPCERTLRKDMESRINLVHTEFSGRKTAAIRTIGKCGSGHLENKIPIRQLTWQVVLYLPWKAAGQAIARQRDDFLWQGSPFSLSRNYVFRHSGFNRNLRTVYSPYCILICDSPVADL